MNSNILLVKPPFFTPWTPPLGISILKSFLAQHGYSVKCIDFNTDAKLWDTHHEYFKMLQSLENTSINDGYSQLWWILNAHMLAHVNGADTATCKQVLETVIPTYRIKHNSNVIRSLIEIVDRYFKRYDELIEAVNLSEFNALGTSTYTTSLASSLLLFQRAKQRDSRITTIMGGGVFADDLALGSDNLTTLIEEYPYVDHVILGEGEQLLLKLLRGDLADKRVISISHLADSTLDMKEVPSPDFSDFDTTHYYHLTIEGARSCPFQCSFCSETIQWGKYRKKPAPQFAQQVIELAERYNNNMFFMGDSLMNPYIIEFSKELLKSRSKILYDGYLRADRPVTDRNRVKVWAESGCYRVRLGIESASARVLEKMDKMTTPAVISDVLKSLSSAGIRTTTYWIVGFPGETEQDFQETLDFITEHYKYIYELEAHPYYYYPYGQIGSRLYASYSLYPPEITKIVKFKVWEPSDCSPAREERYARLRRISKLSSDLGIPNIYTMAERLQAEQRWHLLHPLAVEVYDQSHPSRSKASLPQAALLALPQQVTKKVHCYSVTVNTKLDETVLSGAIEQLVQYNDMLQVTLQDGKYRLGVDEADGSILRDGAEIGVGSKDDPGDFQRKIIEKISEEMAPARGDSMQVALLRDEERVSGLLLLVHHSVADGKSVLLLFEDLFRIYEQLSHGRAVSLRPVKKTYTDFLNELADVNEWLTQHSGPPADGRDRTGSEGKSIGSARMELGATLSRRIVSQTLAKNDFKPFGLLASAFTGALLKTKNGDALQVDLTVDYRSFEPDLEHSVGPLNHVYRMPLREIRGDSVESTVLDTLQALRGFSRGQKVETDEVSSIRVLLDYQYFIEQPWLGGIDWTPEGFVFGDQGLSKSYDIEVIPALLKDNISVVLKYREEAKVTELAEMIVNLLASEMESVLDYCDQSVKAKQFLLEHFGGDSPRSNIDIGFDHASQQATNSVTHAIDRSLADTLRLQFDMELPSIILAAYCVLLSRINGREDLALAFSTGADEFIDWKPIRVHPWWDLSLGDFFHQAQQSIELASDQGKYAFDILSKGLPEFNADQLLSSFDVGYLFYQAPGDGSNDAGKKIDDDAVSQRIKLLLSATKTGAGLNLKLDSKGQSLGAESLRQLLTHLVSILEAAANNPDTKVGQVDLCNKGIGNLVGSLAADEFRF